MSHSDRETVENRINRRMRFRQHNKVTDAVFPITMRRIFDDGTECGASSIGTAFAIKSYKHDCWYLVSNFRCFAGKDPNTGKRIGSFIPNYVDVEFRIEVPAKGYGFLQIKTASLRYPLLSEKNEQAFFDMRNEKEHAFRADLAILPINIPKQPPSESEAMIRIVHSAFWSLNSGADLAVGEECFVVGFPKGMRGDKRLPVWKRASIASEPNSTYAGKLSYLVDTATRKGMSGSPVVVRKLREQQLDQVPSNLSDAFEEKLVGIYSGRLGEKEIEVQLGVVWWIEQVEILIAGLPADVSIMNPVVS